MRAGAMVNSLGSGRAISFERHFDGSATNLIVDGGNLAFMGSNLPERDLGKRRRIAFSAMDVEDQIGGGESHKPTSGE